MARLERRIVDIQEGDLFHASSRDMESILCLALTVRDGLIRARDICRWYEYEFDIVTGLELSGHGGESCLIDSVALLPEVHRMALHEMHERTRNAESEDANRLTDLDIQALLFVGSYYEENKLT
jgi:hypothetical protein